MSSNDYRTISAWDTQRNMIRAYNVMGDLVVEITTTANPAWRVWHEYGTVTDGYAASLTTAEGCARAALAEGD